MANPFGSGGLGTATTGRQSDSIPTGQFFLTTGIFGTAQITAALNLAEQKGQSKTIASPRVTALNNRKAEIESGSQIPVTTVQRNAGSNDEEDGGGLVFTTTFVNVPLRLEVTPQITDAGTVIMDVTAENNTVDPSLAAGTGGTPGISTQRMKTQSSRSRWRNNGCRRRFNRFGSQLKKQNSRTRRHSDYQIPVQKQNNATQYERNFVLHYTAHLSPGL